MAVKATLITRLRNQAQINQQEAVFNDTAVLNDVMDAALIEHDADLGIDTAGYAALPVREEELVLLLAWIRVCYARASFAAPQPSLITPGHMAFGSDRDTPLKKNLALAKALRERYDQLLSDLEGDESDDAEGAAGDITVGEFYRTDEVLSTHVPLLTAPQMPAPVIAQRAVGAGYAIIGWEKMSSSTFRELFLFQSSSAGIHEEWNNDGLGGIPFVKSTATQIYSTTDNIRKAAKITSLAAGTYYFCAAVRDSSGNYVFSNELTVAVT